MARLRWKEGYVVSVRLKDGDFILAQLLKFPYIGFLKTFSHAEDWPVSAAEDATPLFFCAVTSQYMKFSPIRRMAEIRAASFERLPTLWIKSFPGTRKITIWKGTPRERTIILLSGRPGGQLIESHIDAVGSEELRVVINSIPLDDDKTIDEHEMDLLWTYPQLNERLYLCKQLGKCVDPVKDLTFDRPPRDEYSTYYDMLSCHGKPEDWGYSSTPADG